MAVVISLKSERMSFADWTRDTATLAQPSAAKTSTGQRPQQDASRSGPSANARSEPSWKKTFAFPAYSGLLEIVG